MAEPLVRMQGITKQFPGGVLANREANLEVTRGMIHAIVGENGAGKSTLMNILYGLHQPDAGEIYIKGKRVEIASPRTAKKFGIGMVHQHFMLAPSFTVLQNIILGYEPRRLGILVDRKEAHAQVQALCERYHLHLPLSTPVRELSVGMQQRVEIVKAIYRGAELLILDEPTAVLTPIEVQELFQICRDMVAQDKTILFISHKLREVLALSDTITVMRKGQTLEPLRSGETDERKLAGIIVGRDQIWETPGRRVLRDRTPLISVNNLSVRDRQGREAIRNLTLQLHTGEILGIAGVEGNGQGELMAALAGLTPVASGRIEFDGREITRMTVRQRRALGIKHIPEDRLTTGLCLEASIAENLVADPRDRSRFMDKRGIINWKAVAEYTDGIIEAYRIVAPGGNSRAKGLSGGNLQKVVAARELASDHRCLLVLHPTRGLDIGAAEFIYQRMLQSRDAGCGILMVSADLDEIFLISDRIAVMYEGEIVAEFEPEQVTPETVGLYMTGARRQTEDDIDRN